MTGQRDEKEKGQQQNLERKQAKARGHRSQGLHNAFLHLFLKMTN
jgi:hypothetical protein